MTLTLEFFSSIFFMISLELQLATWATWFHLGSPLPHISASLFCGTPTRWWGWWAELQRRHRPQPRPSHPFLSHLHDKQQMWKHSCGPGRFYRVWTIWGISSTHSASWPLLCSFLPPHHCWLCICRLRRCPWSNSSASQSLGFSDLTIAEDKNKSRCATRGFSYYICSTLCSSLN